MSNAWAIEGDAYAAFSAQNTRPDENARPKAFFLIGDEAQIRVAGVLTPFPVLAISNGMAMPIGTSYAHITIALAEADADERVSKIRIIMDSPGGMVDGVRGAMAALRATAKPTTVSVDGMMCSAAYWLGSAADRIEATSTSTIGCLGAMLTRADEPTGERRFISAVSPDKVSANDHEGADQYQVIVDDFAAQLFDDVAQNRDRDRKTVAADFGKGRSLPARLALKAGLIDAIVGPSVGGGSGDVKAMAQDSQAPGDREKEDPMGQPGPDALSADDMEELLAFRAAAAAKAAEALDDVDIDEDPEKLIDEQLDDDADAKAKAKANARVVQADTAARASALENASLKAQLAEVVLQSQHAMAAEKKTRVDALQKSGRIGTDDVSRTMAERAYDSERRATQAYAVAFGCSLAKAAGAQTSDTLFSQLEGRPVAAANPGLQGSSVGGAPFKGTIDEELATPAGMSKWCNEHMAKNDGMKLRAATAQFKAQYPAEYGRVAGVN